MPRIIGHRTTVNHQGQEAEISRRISAPTEFDYTFDEKDDIDYPAIPALKCSWNRDKRRFEVQHFELLRRTAGDPITSQMLRQIPVGEILELALNHVMMHLARVRSTVVLGGFSETISAFKAKKDDLSAMRLTPEKLEWIATIYEMSAALGNKPTQEVSSLFEVSVRTASNWVRTARESGYLD